MSKIFERTTLSNGVRVVTERIPSVRSVSVGVWIGVGSRDEAAEEGGVCHFIEHMVFKGTRKRRMHHIAQRMENVGGYLNAFTAKEYTCFYARCLDEHLDRAIDTVCDLVFNPVFPEKDLEREKDVVIEEMKMYEDTPEDRVFDLLEGALFNGHPMGLPIIGTDSSVKGFSREGLFDFMHRMFSPERIVISIAGNVDHRRAVRFVTRFFGEKQHAHLGTGKAIRQPIPPYLPSRTDEQKQIQQAHIVLGTRAYDVHDDRRVALSVLNTILGGGMSSRLNQNIRERYGYCYNIYSFVNMHADTGDFGVYMGTDESKMAHAERLIFRELDKLNQTAIKPRALDRAKSQVKGSIMLGLESMGSRMMRMGRQELYYEQYFSLDEILEMVDAVTAPEVLDVAQDLFHRSRFSVVRLIPGDPVEQRKQTLPS